MSPFPDRAETQLIDTSCISPFLISRNVASSAAAERTKSQIKDADVLVLVYDVSRAESKQRVASFWLTLLTVLRPSVPILVVGNKLDLVAARDAERDEKHKGFVDALVKEYPQVEMGIECSAKEHRDLADLVYCAQRAVIYPIQPLFDHKSKVLFLGFTPKELRPKYVCALRRIFRICDADRDGFLGDSEFPAFQVRGGTIPVRRRNEYSQPRSTRVT